jgi:hypothetical protein
MVIDTNVAAVAQGLHQEASSACQISCIEFLIKAQSNGRVSIDEAGLIASEYIKVLGASGRPGVGRAFVKWLLDNQYDDRRSERVPLTARPDWRLFDQFPDDNELRLFDSDDRKFVAVAVASEFEAVIYNAVDSDYAEHAVALGRYVCVVQLCR